MTVLAKRKKRLGWFWTAALSFAVGYVSAAVCRMTPYAAQAPTVATVAAVVLTMVLVAGRPGRLMGGAVRGLGIGLAAGAGAAMAVMPTDAPAASGVAWRAAAAGTIVAVVAATLVGPASAAGIGIALVAPAARERVGVGSFQTLAAVVVLVPTLCCCAAGAVFGLLAERRARAAG